MITQPSSSTPRTARRWTTPWRNMLSPSSGLTLYERFEQAIMLVLIGLIMAVTVSATAHLVVAVWHLLSSSAVDPTDQRVFQTVFGAVFTVLIALEFKHSLLAVLAHGENIVRVRTIVLIALLAIARKFILLDLQTIAPMDVLSLAAAVLALGIVYWLVRDQDARADARIRQQDASLRKDVPDAQ